MYVHRSSLISYDVTRSKFEDARLTLDSAIKFNMRVMYSRIQFNFNRQVPLCDIRVSVESNVSFSFIR